jgi:hypothetical protein
MNYCALEDAFQEGGAPTPGCAQADSAKAARKEERRKARRCKGPPATYLDMDPDRQPPKLPEVNAMNSNGLVEHVPFSMERYEPFQDSNSSIPSHSEVPSESVKKKFFGADPEGIFADYIPDQQDYQLKPDFSKAFEGSGVAKAGSIGSSKLPKAASNMYWKPLSQSAFTESKSNDQMHEMMRKMDKIFARLDDMNYSNPEQMTSELLMFISSGVFMIFMVDLLVRKASSRF